MPDQQRAEALADALAEFGFPLVTAHPRDDERWNVTAVDPGPYPRGTAGHRALDAGRRQAAILASRYGGHPLKHSYVRADKVSTAPPPIAPVLRYNPGARPPVPIIPMIPPPPAHPLPLGPDNYYQPGPVDLSMLDAVLWHQLDHAYSDNDIPTTVRQLVDASDEEWRELLYRELMPTVVHQGTCYSATPPIASVFAELATSPRLPARRRRDIYGVLLAIADCEAADMVRDADHAIVDHRVPLAQRWAIEAHEAIGAAVPAMLALWSQQPPAIQFTLVVFAGLYPEHGTASATHMDAFSAEYARTQPGAYLQLATALRDANEGAAVAIACEITRWDKEARPEWLEAPAVPARIRCRHLLAQGAARMPSTQ